MTTAAKIRRAFRHKNERTVIQHLEQSPWGKQARPSQLVAGARKILRNYCSAQRRVGIIAAP